MDIQSQIIALLQGEVSEGNRLKDLLQTMADSPEQQRILLDQIHMSRHFAQAGQSITPSLQADQKVLERVSSLRRMKNPATQTSSFYPSRTLFLGGLSLLLLIGIATGYMFGIHRQRPHINLVDLSPNGTKSVGLISDKPDTSTTTAITANPPTIIQKEPVLLESDLSTTRDHASKPSSLHQALNEQQSRSGLLQFDGQDDLIMVPEFTGFNDSSANFTIEAFIRPEDVKQTSWFATYTAPDEKGNILFGIDGGKVRLITYDLYNVATDIVSDQAIAPGVWYHIAGVQDAESGKLRLYINGLLAGEVNTIPVRQVAAGEFLIGARDWFSTGRKTEFFKGEIRDVKIWERQLSQGEVFSSMTSDIPQTSDLIAYWPINEGKGNVVQDRIGRHNGTMVGPPQWKPRLQ
ncbi:MAG: LamG domain-containing protein [Candidatus Kapaibacterium sp.]